MSVVVTSESVERALQPWLGSYLLNATQLPQQLTDVVIQYRHSKQTLSQLKDRISSELITGISRFTQGRMGVILDDYHCRWLTLNDIAQITDHIMELVFRSLIPFSGNFEKLSEYVVHEESLSAMKVLYLDYQSYFTDGQYQSLILSIKQAYPKERYSAWLKT